jgi:glycosyltransferase involved in cell wall biosynthesis
VDFGTYVTEAVYKILDLIMHCPTLNELPLPALGETGWPWTEETLPLPERMPSGSRWPRITIVTPSLNQGRFIEETIRSVLLQGYPNLEYIIIDGGSSDQTLEIIKKYERWLTYWVSEPDKGQSQAVNKGFSHASGQIFAYINSDDVYASRAFAKVAGCLSEDSKNDVLAGRCAVLADGPEKRIFEPGWPEDLSFFLRKTFSSTFAQPASFWTKNVYDHVGGFDESLHYCFDREFFLKIGLAGFVPSIILHLLARFREHPNSKTMLQTGKFHEESIVILNRYAAACGIPDREKRAIAKHMRDEILYLQVFNRWRQRGRLAAGCRFLSMICNSPLLLKERKILGQARRLLLFREKAVAELQ